MKIVLIEQPEEHIRIIRLNRPEKLNAMNAELMQAMFEAFQEVGKDNSCRVAILTGNGRGFCSGLDLDNSGVIPNIENLTVPRLAMRSIGHFARVVPALRAMPMPVICAINGPAFGGGMCLTLGADIRICSASTTFNATGINNGLTSTELGASWLLPRLIGASRANEIMLSGRIIDAEEALRIGLVSQLTPDEEVLDCGLTLARKMCRFSPHGLAMTKATCWSNLEIAGLEAAIELENRNQILLGMTTNLEEKISSRKEGREPVYRDLPMNWPQDWEG